MWWVLGWVVFAEPLMLQMLSEVEKNNGKEG